LAFDVNRGVVKSMSEFVHLHVHSYYSLLDGCPSPAELAQAAAQTGMPALALTDHDALYGAIEFYDACHQAGVKPIVGLELTVDSDNGSPDTLVLLARNLEGYANLCRLSSALQTQSIPQKCGGLTYSDGG
jgi:DNA polymerase III alpha subunit